MRLLTANNKKVCGGIFIFIFTMSIGFMLGTLQTIEIQEEKAKLADQLNQLELELFEAERQIVHCDSELGHKMNAMISGETYKTIYIVTPTYTRPTQLEELTLLSQAIAHVPYLQWVLLEVKKTSLVSDFLASTNLNYEHLDSGGKFNPSEQGLNTCNALRNVGLDFLGEEHRNASGVVLFANLDRFYSAELFEKVRNIEKVGIWPTIFAKEQFTCKPLQFSEKAPKYPINLGSVGFSNSALYNSGRRFPVKVSDTAGVSHLVEGVVKGKEDVTVISCEDQLVWFTKIF